MALVKQMPAPCLPSPPTAPFKMQNVAAGGAKCGKQGVYKPVPTFIVSSTIFDGTRTASLHFNVTVLLREDKHIHLIST